ncbi:RNA ligase family protein [Methylocystis heyeri]|uniref:DNA ligase n=1 Tax=Methylocystis heyeri TaxID=391905 RepID=A0A6B8K8W6_9HYPH|nr:RNA ligase family protein [Methylocystis heyeri]QGM44496.1 DNA ligase [Methylocystis heyeri]
MSFVKYPRTPHLVGSRLQPGDDTSGQVALSDLKGGLLVFEEKLDGANAAVSFDASDRLLLQSRGHVLSGGPRETQFNLFKAWAQTHENWLRRLLQRRFVMYGEWCFAKHTVFYDLLPHYFHEFDIYDKDREIFLSTARRRQMLAGLPVISVPVMHRGPMAKGAKIASLIAPSLYKSMQWRENLEKAAQGARLDAARIRAETENSILAEGIYLKHESEDTVIGRYKYVRADFHQAILDSGSHWQDRPILPNGLAPEVDIFEGADA